MAKQYTFRLEPLLKLRRQREDEKKRAVAARLGQIGVLEQRRQKLLSEIGDQAQVMRTWLSGGCLEMNDVRLGRHWLLRLQRGVLETGALMSTQRAILAQERTELTEARKNTKVLERLKERRRTAYVAMLNRREQIELDDLNVTRFAHARAAALMPGLGIEVEA
jgi:flagellar export protein FliJ